jgi:cytochrome c oxidase assembly factor CtaG/putative copper export protein
MTKISPPRCAAYGPLVLVGGVLTAAAGLAVYCAASGAQRYAEIGNAYPGMATSLAATIGYFLAAVCGGAVLGGRVFVLAGARPDADGKIDAGVYRAHLLVERAAIAWALIAAAMAVVSAADAGGVGVGRLVASGAIGDMITASEAPRAWIVVFLCAAVSAISSLRWVANCVLLVPAAIGVVPVAVTGNAGQGPNHDYATSSAIVFWVAIAVWLGVKAAWVDGLGRDGEVCAARSDPVFRRRMARVVVGCWGLALAYGAVLLSMLLPARFVLTTAYGRLAILAAILLAAAGAIDVVVLIRLRRDPQHRVAVSGPVTMVMLTAAVAAIAALATRTAPGLLAHHFTVWDILLGYRLPGPPNALRLVADWRFDTLIGVAAIVAAALYLTGVRRLRRRGDRWSAGRTVSWLAGCVGLLVVSSSGVKAYGSAMFSVHMAEHMTLNMFVPVLLVLGAPVTLALRALPAAGDDQPPGPREWLVRLIHSPVTGVFAHPVVAFLLFVVSLYLVYFTEVFDTLARYHWGHELLSIHFLLVGYLFFWVVVGEDPGPRRLPFLGRLGLLFAVMPFHAFFGIATMTMTGLIGGTFYRYLSLPWLPNLNHDQWLGGAIAWASSELPVIIVVVVLVAQWARSDRREAARHDRHADSEYGDDELAAYNAMLAELARLRR